MSEHRGEREKGDAETDQTRYFRLHGLAYALGVAVLVAVDLAVTDGWWSFWPVFAWSVILLVHYLYLRSTHVDSRWVEERESQVLDKAYDLGHIEDIRQRYQGEKPRDGDRQRPEN